MKYKSKISTLSVVMLPLLLAACSSGDGDNGGVEPIPVEPEATNRAPVATAGANKSVWEQGSVILDARSSNDADGDSLSYQWTQTAGESVTLSNMNSAQPSFVAPEVDAVTELVFEVQVSDANQAMSTDTTTITVMDQTLEQRVNQMMVHPVSKMITAETGKAVNVPFEYKTAEGVTSPIGLMLKLHWNSSHLSFKELGEVLAVNHLGVSTERMDSQDHDNNPDTDKYVILSWLDYENTEWLNNIGSSAVLFAASFEPVEGAVGTTHVTLSPHFVSPGYKLHSQIVSVEM